MCTLHCIVHSIRTKNRDARTVLIPIKPKWSYAFVCVSVCIYIPKANLCA